MSSTYIQETQILNNFLLTLGTISNMQNEQFKENNPILFSSENAINMISMIDQLFSLNLAESQNENIFKTGTNINNIMILCLEANLLPGESNKIELKNSIIEYTLQNSHILADGYRFSDVEFPSISIFNATESYGISRTIWGNNPYPDNILQTEHLAAKLSSIKLNRMKSYEELRINNLWNKIRINFNVIDQSSTYYCMYFDEIEEEFTDYGLETRIVGDEVICETSHLSWFGVSKDPLVTIATENNAKMLYDLNALANYHFWESPSTYTI